VRKVEKVRERDREIEREELQVEVEDDVEKCGAKGAKGGRIRWK